MVPLRQLVHVVEHERDAALIVLPQAVGDLRRDRVLPERRIRLVVSRRPEESSGDQWCVRAERAARPGRVEDCGAGRGQVFGDRRRQGGLAHPTRPHDLHHPGPVLARHRALELEHLLPLTVATDEARRHP